MSGLQHALDELDRYTRQQVDEGLLGAAQWAVAHEGQVLHHSAHGAASTQDRFVIFSATKAIVAMALLPALQRGDLQLTEPVARTLASFSHRGKERVTLLQLLTMQGGFPQAVMPAKAWGDPAARAEVISNWTLDWPAGAATEYHPMSAHWVIADLIEATEGRHFDEVVNDLVSAAGAAPLLGKPQRAPITIRSIGEVNTDHAALAVFFGAADLVPSPSVAPDALLSLNDPRAQAAAIPGGGGITNAADVTLIYQSFVNGNELLPDQWRIDAVSNVRNVSINRKDGLPANRTIAGIVSGYDSFREHRWFPDLPNVFGHHGAGGQLCWVDVDSGVSFCFLHDTIHLDTLVESTRVRRINALAKEIVQLAVYRR